MKESGINYFYSGLSLDTDSFAILYTFEEGAGTNVASISIANPLFSGTITGDGSSFWDKPGSGLFSGNHIEINQASGLDSNLSFSHILSYEQVTTGKQILYINRSNLSGYEFGLNDANKLYFETAGSEPIIATSLNNLSSKNLISISYINNFLSFGYYNFNAQKFEFDNFQYNFDLQASNLPRLGSGFTGYIDYYLYSNDYLGAETLNNLVSGWYAKPTGFTPNTVTICNEGITGYQDGNYFITGITGYQTTGYVFNDGVGVGTGLFPSSGYTEALTGILSSGVKPIALTGLICETYSGLSEPIYQINESYISGFGMDKSLILHHVSGNDIIKRGDSKLLFDNHYNFNLQELNSGYYNEDFQTNTGNINLFFNGLANTLSGTELRNGFLFITGSDSNDLLFFDLASGNRNYSISGRLDINYTGQEVFFNGINLISGYDFRAQGNQIFLTGNNTGISGVLFEYPLFYNSQTGNSVIYTGQKFSRDSSIYYFNGLRLRNRNDYIEGSDFDLLKDQNFDEENNLLIYDNNGQFWE